uniref:Uncharacterized protein n=1 Tax=Mycena chlorophos TaxID=658473 RepID=A0ABQ0L0A4_MYCCL|nr:predicted protein [Mycena chlorophos]
MLTIASIWQVSSRTGTLPVPTALLHFAPQTAAATLQPKQVTLRRCMRGSESQATPSPVWPAHPTVRWSYAARPRSSRRTHSDSLQQRLLRPTRASRGRKPASHARQSPSEQCYAHPIVPAQVFAPLEPTHASNTIPFHQLFSPFPRPVPCPPAPTRFRGPVGASKSGSHVWPNILHLLLDSAHQRARIGARNATRLARYGSGSLAHNHYPSVGTALLVVHVARPAFSWRPDIDRASVEIHSGNSQHAERLSRVPHTHPPLPHISLEPPIADARASAAATIRHNAFFKHLGCTSKLGRCIGATPFSIFLDNALLNPVAALQGTYAMLEAGSVR